MTKQEEIRALKAEEAELVNTVAKYDLHQKATKISLNSLYGILGNEYFRFYSIDNAEAVTLTGQFIIKYIARELDRRFNAWCKTQNKRYVLYCDTDSVYIACDTVVEALRSHNPELTDVKIVDELDKMCRDSVEPFITKTFRHMVATCLNGCGDYLRMKREIIANKAMWTAKKRYIVNVYDDEGVRHIEPELKYVGVEIAKASAPKFCRDAMLEAVKILMRGEKDTLWKLVEKTHEQFLTLPPEDIAFPRSVSGLEKYSSEEAIWGKGTPFPVKGALLYNHYVQKFGLQSKYQNVKEGEKIKYLYLKEPNPTRDRVISFLNILPKEFGLHGFVDYEMQFTKSFMEPLSLILNPVGWTTEPIASLDSFWE